MTERTGNTIYIAGPMRGRPRFNFPAFDRAAHLLRENGWLVISPAEMDRDFGFDETAPIDETSVAWQAFMRDARKRDIAAITERATAMYMLAGWRESAGARAEFALAEWLDLTIYEEGWPIPGAYPHPGMPTMLRPEPPLIVDERDTDAEPGLPPVLPTDSAARKRVPLYRGLFLYFPHALAAVAEHSAKGNEQHHPGTPLHWDRAKSTDEEDALLRHVLEGDWTAAAWRALAKLQKHIETKGNDR